MGWLFFSHHVVKYNEKEEKQKEQLENYELIFEILRNSNHSEYHNVINAIRKNINHLMRFLTIFFVKSTFVMIFQQNNGLSLDKFFINQFK